jgi:hexokinase
MDIKSWLKEQMVAAEAYNADTLLTAFLEEMKKGLVGDESSSLAMIPAHVGIGEKVPPLKSVAVIDAGGTNLRIGMAYFDDNGEIHLSDFSKQDMPGRDREVTASEFYVVLADNLQRLNGDFDTIGFCFSYPAEIQPNLDGRLLHWTKEVKIPELVDKEIGKGLLEVLAQRGITGKRIVVLNDTVAALLAGLAQGQTFNASSYIGFILGSGTNTAYVERNQNIGKLNGHLGQGAQVINVESGGFAAFDRGPFDLEMDRCSENCGKNVFEKIISGVYMGDLTLQLLQALEAQNDMNIFSKQGAAVLLNMKELSNVHISNLAADNGKDTGVLNSKPFTDADRIIMKMVFAAVVERAAFLTAVNIAAVVIKSGEGSDAERPVCVNIDGTTYYKTHQLADKVQSHLSQMLDARGLHIRCIHVQDAPVVGAAIAGLTAFQ